MKTQTQLLVVMLLAIFQLFQFREIHAVNPDTQYTPVEKEGLRKLKQAVSGILYDDYQKMDSYLIHYLRRTKLDVNQATTLMKETFKWRKANKIDTILQEKQMIEMEKSFPVTVDGTDKEGRPTLSYILQKWDIRRFVLAGRLEEFRRYQIYIMEKATKKVYELATSGQDVSQFNIVIDFSGFNTREHGCLPCLQGISEFVPLTDTRYPKLVNQVIMVNSPRSFATALKFIKGLLSPDAQKLIHVFGYDKPEWRAHIQKHFDDDQIATAFGGTRTTRRAN